MPTSSRKGEPRHPENIEIYNKLVKMKVALDLRGRRDASYCYGKVISTLEKYPLPIISLRQAIKLDGIGTKLLTTISDIINHKYEDHKLPTNNFTSNSQSGSNSKLKDYISKKVKRNEISEAKAVSAPPSVKKLHKVKLNSKDSLLLTSLYLRQKDDESRSFFTRNEISQASESNTLFDESSRAEFNMKTFERLEKCRFIEKLDFEIDYKYSLTVDGHRMAQEYFSQPVDAKSKHKAREVYMSQSVFKQQPEKEIVPLKLHKSDVKSCEVKLYIDNREKKMKNNTSYFIDELKFANLNVQLKSLPLADFGWVAEVTTKDNRKYVYLLDYLIERKTLDDLVCSIKDGRYKDQKKRLKSCGASHIYYLIEGDIQKEGSFAGLNTAINTMRIVDNFNLVNTENARGSVDFLIKLHMRIKRTVDQLLKNDVIYFNQTYDDFFKRQYKFKNMKLKNATLNAVSRFKGFGEGTAIKIASFYPTFRHLYERLNDDWSEQDDLLKTFLNKNQRKLLYDLICKSDYGK